MYQCGIDMNRRRVPFIIIRERDILNNLNINVCFCLIWISEINAEKIRFPFFTFFSIL